MPYREKRIYSGDMMEVEIYYISDKDRDKTRKQKLKESSTKQKNLNDKNAKKHIIRLINRNFTDADLRQDLDYRNDCLPSTPEEANRNLENYLRRVSRYRKKNGFTPLKYIAVTEYHDPSLTDKRKKIRKHHHIVMSGMDREIARSLWGKGRANNNWLDADEYGYEGLARYLVKDPRGAKRWKQSKNLKQPIIKINDYKFSKKKTDQLSMYLEDRELFEKLYPGYTYTECKASVNDITASRQIYIKMRKRTEEQKEGGTYVKRAKFD